MPLSKEREVYISENEKEHSLKTTLQVYNTENQDHCSHFGSVWTRAKLREVFNAIETTKKISKATLCSKVLQALSKREMFVD